MEISPSPGLVGHRVYLSVVRLSIPMTRLAADPALCGLAAEDAVWNLERADWHRQRPHWWQLKAIHVWRCDGASLTNRRGDLLDLARTLGMPV